MNGREQEKINKLLELKFHLLRILSKRNETQLKIEIQIIRKSNEKK